MNEIILMRYFRAVKIPLKAHKNAGGGPIGWPLYGAGARTVSYSQFLLAPQNLGKIC